MKGKIEMQSERKLVCYRILRNHLCAEISRFEASYKNAPMYGNCNVQRKDCLEYITFYKDVLAILTKNKELICDDN